MSLQSNKKHRLKRKDGFGLTLDYIWQVNEYQERVLLRWKVVAEQTRGHKMENVTYLVCTESWSHVSPNRETAKRKKNYELKCVQSSYFILLYISLSNLWYSRTIWYDWGTEELKCATYYYFILVNDQCIPISTRNFGPERVQRKNIEVNYVGTGTGMSLSLNSPARILLRSNCYFSRASIPYLEMLVITWGGVLSGRLMTPWSPKEQDNLLTGKELT
jgi:hypothetical protein